MGDMVDEQKCDNCYEIMDCIPHWYWIDKDFTLCLKCMLHFVNGDAPKFIKSPTTQKEAIPTELRWEILERDNFTCQYCASRRFLSIDHIIPESQGGTLDKQNLVTACKSCNSIKGARTPEQAGMKLRNSER